MSKAKQQRNASYAAGYFDGYSGNCYCIGTGAQVFRSLYHRGYVKGSSDAAKRTAKYRATHMHHGKLVQRPALCIILWNLFWHQWNARF
ncbi:hypothetical protein [Xenorhabdus bovienii]|uniref:hypothetical protein n=1 Tax=Xenorhabdus bovienii TaxID=40576 RepID=UPI0023B2EE59|nr:hypothetical protein [Xenorhabdus bovienii]